MKKTILCLMIFAAISSKLHSQYANVGTGALKNQIWWFDWNGFTISNGASRTFTTGDGLNVTVTFSNVQGPVFQPNVMNTWYGSVLHFLYDFSSALIKPALLSPYTTQNSQFTVSVTATRNGTPAPFKFIAADAEASAITEVTTLTTNGSNWLCVDFFRNSTQTSNPFTGCNTQTATITDTYGGGSSGIGQNPVIATDNAGGGPLTVNCTFNRNGVEGEMGIAFGIFGSVDLGDLPAGYGFAQHTLKYTTTNPCNYLPPLPSTTLVQNLKIGNVAGDADPVQTTDDNANGVDEDGVTSFPLYTGSGSYSLTIPVTNTTGNTAYLTGWFDHNRNGIFDNNEYVTGFIPDNATTSVLTWAGLPATLPQGSTNGWAFRFRLSSVLSATLNPSGYAPDGEVEDYLTTSLLVSCNTWLNTPSNGSKVLLGDLDVTGNQVTVEALFNRTQPLNSGAYYGHLVSKHTDQTNVNYALLPNGCEITTTGSGYKAIFQDCPLQLNRTYHVAMVYNGSSLKYYRDGYLLSQIPCTGNIINNDLLTTIGQVAGGSDPTNNQFLGYINEVRIWNVERTQNQLQTYMNASLPNPTTQAGLLGYYSFNDLLNKQGNTAWNGSLAGAASVNQANPNCTFNPEYCNTGTPNVIPGFTIPDTVCINTPVTATNTSTNATTFYWNFCSGSLNASPAGSNFASPGFSLPAFSDMVQDGNNYYVFVVNHTGSLAKMSFGNSLLNTPTIIDLGSFGGIIPFQAEGIEIQKDGANWIGYIIGGQNANSRLLKLSFGTSVANIPTATNLGNVGGLAYPVDFTLQKDATGWYGFTVSADNNTVTRFNFGNSLNNTPVATNLGNIGTLNYPVGIFMIKDGNNYHLFITNRNSHTISRLDFGTSLANVPAGTNLGNPGNNFNWPRDITVIRDCDRTFGFVTNEGTNNLTRLDFTGANLLSVPVTTNLGNIGNMNFPSSISEIFRTGDAVNFISTNVNSNSISRITFNNCTASSIPSYTGATPPSFQYTQPGTYNISLFVDEGLATQSVVCKQIVAKACSREISGIVNDYTEVLGFDPCHNKLTVANASAYNVGDTVLLIQMKGAVIDSTNTAAFGTVTDYKNAGNYEYNYVKSKSGNVIELKNFLLRQYDIPDGKVQLIRVPYYDDVNVASTLTCLPWDGGKGGVVAINVQNKLQLSANIDVAGKGFRGGIDPVSNPASMYCNESQYYYPANPDLASGKGEGIADISSAKSFGRGALANGGGGGNSHNAGGGGGSNATSGGYGGYNYELAPCTNAPFDNRGIGGNGLVYSNAANKIFLGGGGGAGHSNNPEGFQAKGGNGSGIIILSANTLDGNGSSLRAFGSSAPGCSGLGATGCHEGMGGGGAGGTILLNVNSYIGDLAWNSKGGQGADMIIGGFGKLGPGGGASGGVTWYKSSSVPVNIVGAALSGGGSGVNTQYANDPWGSTSGSNGIQLFNLQVPVSTIPFKPNIDSLRIQDSLIGCRSFYFKGFGFTNTYPIIGWRWTFSDGDSALTQNTNHTFAGAGDFYVKLVVTDINGCKDSINKLVHPTTLNPDFTYQINTCDPLSVQFNGSGSISQNPYWSFGDVSTMTGVLAPVHPYASYGTYIVKYVINNGVCSDTAIRTINLALIPGDVVRTHDTTICFGATKQLLTIPSGNFCWTPTTYLDNPNSSSPITSTPQNITYYYTAEITGSNRIVNGDFSQGNTGFTSEYIYKTPPNTSVGQYYIGTSPQAWSAAYMPCTDHTSNSGNMMIVNGNAQNYAAVWSQTVAVQPNTIYSFSAWILHITGNISSPEVQFSINGNNLGPNFQASTTSCVWKQFYTTWNSGSNTSAVISILNKDVPASGNDYALDDISFAPTFIKRDSVKITVDSVTVRTNDNVTVCPGTPVQLNTTGAATYLWSPSTGLSNTNIANPVASPLVTTQYFVTGTNLNGCTGKDSVTITINPKLTITKSGDATICKNASVQLSASGGTNYVWSPAATLDDPNIANPVASPTTTTTYYVSVTDGSTCSNTDSVKVTIRPDPVFTISPPVTICQKDTIRLNATGGNIYQWYGASLSNAFVPNPYAAPSASTLYFVEITESTCNYSMLLSTRVDVNPLPILQVTKSNDIDCSNDRSQLIANGAQTYIWSPASSLSNPRISTPVAMPTSNTMYIVKGTDASGCSNYDSVKVEFVSINASGYFMPNAFTPNGDGLNDCYGIRYWGVIKELEFSIYNRWGERVFFTKNPAECWDGTFKGQKQSTAVFVYMIKAKTLCGDTFKKGLLTLIR